MAERTPEQARPAKKTKFSSFFRSPLFKVLLSIFLFLFIGASALVLYYYNYYSKVIDRRLSGEIFKNTAQIYAAPYRIYPGQKLAPDEVVLRLQRAGLLAPDGDVSKVLVTVINNLEITNKLDIQPDVRARVLLTTPLESFTVPLICAVACPQTRLDAKMQITNAVDIPITNPRMVSPRLWTASVWFRILERILVCRD